MDATSKSILEFRINAFMAMDLPYGLNCPTCRGTAPAPYRVVNADGDVVMGCIDAHHSGSVEGIHRVWHDRPEAAAIRERALEHLRSL